MSDENLDKCKFVEKKLDIRQGFLSQSEVSQVK